MLRLMRTDGANCYAYICPVESNRLSAVDGPEPSEDFDANGVKFTYNLRFPEQYYDQETGLHYNYFRDYDPSIGRYVESDPAGLAGGLNTYAYVDSRPTLTIDPLGLKGFYCRRPLGQLPGELGPPVFNHQYVCVTNPDGSTTCGGLTTDGNLLSSDARLTMPDEDYYDSNSCRQVDGDEDQCFEQCVRRNFAEPDKPRYGIGPQGTDCQEYANDLYSGYKALCNIQEGQK